MAAIHGRDAERKMVADLLRCARRGTGGVVLVEGEPGTGKSVLLGEATDAATGQGFSLVAGVADQLGQEIPFLVLRDILGEQAPAAGHPGRERADATAWWITRIRTQLRRRAATTPVLVCLDDLHWASPASLAALRILPGALARHPVAWLLARSTTPRHGAEQLFGLLEKEGAARTTLAPLEQDAVTELLTEAFGAPPDQALADLARDAAGNPSLVAGLIAGLRDNRAVCVTGGRAALWPPPMLWPDQRPQPALLPRRVHQLARQRLDGLSQRARHLLATAAVLDPAFRIEDAAQMLGTPPAALLPAVQEAIDASIITVTEHDFAFRHQLLRRAISEMIPGPARQAMHRQYGEILLARGESADRAACHLLRAACPAGRAAYPADRAALTGLDQAAARTRGSAPQAAAGLAVRAMELTPPADPAALIRTVAAAEALTAAGRLDHAARIARGCWPSRSRRWPRPGCARRCRRCCAPAARPRTPPTKPGRPWTS